MHIFSAAPQSHSSPKPKVHDPVFVVMLLAVILAVCSSLVLRFTVGMGPKSARAESSEVPSDQDLTSDKTPAPTAHTLLKPH